MTETASASNVVTPQRAAAPARHTLWVSARLWTVGAMVATFVLALLPHDLLAPSFTLTEALRIVVAIAAGARCIGIDIREHRIPDRITIPALCAIVGSAVIESMLRTTDLIAAGPAPATGQAAPAVADFLAAAEPAVPTLVGSAVFGGTLLALAWSGTLGLGDVKLGAVLGGALLPAFGWPGLIVAFAASYLIALPHALFLLGSRRRGGRRAELAFGPYLVGGAVAALLLGTIGALPWSDA